MPNVWELVTEASALPVAPSNTFWNHLNTLASGDIVFKHVEGTPIQVLPESEPLIEVLLEPEAIITVLDCEC